MDYAVVETGGKQYTVREGELIRVEKLPVEDNAVVELKEVLLVKKGGELKVGNPTVEGATVVCQVEGTGRAKKIVVFKKKRRKGYTKKQGHRQWFTTLRVKEIKV